ncbi:MAG TPA: glycoside hydrolase domain-containing protein [Nocardioides sp.]|nr:glycoside hydrolase domain-containing protein [Nocardioides sp.]
MAKLGIDYSYARPDPAAIRAAGYSFAVRYISGVAGKDLAAAEARALHAAGLSILLVFETTASRASQGAAAGAIDAAAAERLADALHYPAACPVFYAVDFNADPLQVEAYFDAVRRAARHPVGIYGGVRVMTVTADYRWQACAWSGAVVSPHAHLYQRLHPTVAHPIKGTDEDIMLMPVPMWDPAPAHGPAPSPPPVPAPRPLSGRRLQRAIRQVWTLHHAARAWRRAHPHWSRSVRLAPVIHRLGRLLAGLRARRSR